MRVDDSVIALLEATMGALVAAVVRGDVETLAAIAAPSYLESVTAYHHARMVAGLVAPWAAPLPPRDMAERWLLATVIGPAEESTP